MNKEIIFYVLVGGFTGGIFLSSFIKIGFSFFLFLLVLAFCIYLFSKIFADNKNTIYLLVFFLFSFALGILRYEIKDLNNNDSDLKQFVNEKIILSGTVIDEPNVKDKSTELVVEMKEVALQDKRTAVMGKVLVTTSLFPEYHYSDEVQIEGLFDMPKNFSTSTGNDFDYVGYLAKEDIYYVMNFANVKIISSGQNSGVEGSLFRLKSAFTSKINSLIKEPESSLLGGLLLGAKNSLGKNLQTEFRQAGVSHIVALSGYNITIVAESVMIALSFLPKFLSISFGVLSIIFFTIMTGGGATVVRASIMALLVILAKTTNRKYDISRALFLAGVFMLIHNPKILVFDISFQLSFLATMALVYLSPILEKKMLFLPEKYKFRSLVVSTISTQIFVLPFILYKMSTLSLVALPANLLILPVIPTIMLFGFLSGVFGFVSVWLSVPVAFLASLLLSYMLMIISFFAHLPFSYISISLPIFLVILIYIFFLWYIYRERGI